MLDELAESFLINNRVNLRLIDGISDEGLDATLSTRGGRTVGMQLVHIYTVRRSKLEKASKPLVENLPELEREDGSRRDLLVKAFEDSAEAVAQLIRSAEDGKVKGFRRGIVALVGYLISHDAHHRGHIMLTLKQAKIKRPRELAMSLWDWNKI